MNPVLLIGLIFAAWVVFATVAGSAAGTAIRFLRNDQYWDDRDQVALVEEER